MPVVPQYQLKKRNLLFTQFQQIINKHKKFYLQFLIHIIKCNAIYNIIDLGVSESELFN